MTYLLGCRELGVKAQFRVDDGMCLTENERLIQKESCCVPLCNTRGGHKFPLDPVQRQLWISAIKVKRKEANWTPSRWSVVCQVHFEPSDYDSEITGFGSQRMNRKLKAGVVPHIFNRKGIGFSSVRSPGEVALRNHEIFISRMREIEEKIIRERLTRCQNIGNHGNNVKIKVINEHAIGVPVIKPQAAPTIPNILSWSKPMDEINHLNIVQVQQKSNTDSSPKMVGHLVGPIKIEKQVRARNAIVEAHGCRVCNKVFSKYSDLEEHCQIHLEKGLPTFAQVTDPRQHTINTERIQPTNENSENHKTSQNTQEIEIKQELFH